MRLGSLGRGVESWTLKLGNVMVEAAIVDFDQPPCQDRLLSEIPTSCLGPPVIDCFDGLFCATVDMVKLRYNFSPQVGGLAGPEHEGSVSCEP